MPGVRDDRRASRRGGAGAGRADRARDRGDRDGARARRVRIDRRIRADRGHRDVRGSRRRCFFSRQADVPLSVAEGGRNMVNVRTLRSGGALPRADVVLVPVGEGRVQAALRRLDRRTATRVAQRVKQLEFRGRPDDVLVHHGDTSVVLLGLGPTPAPTEVWRRAGARGRQEAERQRARRVIADVGATADDADALGALVEGFQMAGYRFAGYASEPNRRPQVTSLALHAPGVRSPGTLRTVLAEVDAIVPEIFRARDLVNEPASVATPRFLAERVTELGKAIPALDVEVWDPDRIAKEGLAGLTAVARGSREEPRFITLRHAPDDARRRVVLIG